MLILKYIFRSKDLNPEYGHIGPCACLELAKLELNMGEQELALNYHSKAKSVDIVLNCESGK